MVRRRVRVRGKKRLEMKTWVEMSVRRRIYCSLGVVVWFMSLTTQKEREAQIMTMTACFMRRF